MVFSVIVGLVSVFGNRAFLSLYAFFFFKYRCIYSQEHKQNFSISYCIFFQFIEASRTRFLFWPHFGTQNCFACLTKSSDLSNLPKVVELLFSLSCWVACWFPRVTITEHHSRLAGLKPQKFILPSMFVSPNLPLLLRTVGFWFGAHPNPV